MSYKVEGKTEHRREKKVSSGTLVRIYGTATPSGQSRAAYVKSNRGKRYKLESPNGEIWHYWRDEFTIDENG